MGVAEEKAGGGQEGGGRKGKQGGRGESWGSTGRLEEDGKLGRGKGGGVVEGLEETKTGEGREGWEEGKAGK
jgi:hypothetical protein